MTANPSSQSVPGLMAGPTAASTNELRAPKVRWSVWILVFGAGIACSAALNIVTWWIFAQWAAR